MISHNKKTTRMPAEWEPHRATWIAWPHNDETWPGRLEAVQKRFLSIIRVLAIQEEVEILVPDTRHGDQILEQLLIHLNHLTCH